MRWKSQSAKNASFSTCLSLFLLPRYSQTIFLPTTPLSKVFRCPLDQKKFFFPNIPKILPLKISKAKLVFTPNYRFSYHFCRPTHKQFLFLPPLTQNNKKVFFSPSPTPRKYHHKGQIEKLEFRINR